MQKIIGRHVLLAIIAFILVFSVFTGAQAAVSFEGKVLTFVVPVAAGGGTDMWARMLARHLGKYLPGKPGVVVRNITGGAAVIGANYVWNAKPNGRTLLASSADNVMPNVFRFKGMDYKLQEMVPLYAAPIGWVLYGKPGLVKDLVKDPKDIMTAKGIIFGQVNATGGGSCIVWAKELLGFKTENLVWGYSGGSAARQAFIQGELTTSGESTVAYNAALKPFVEKGEAVPIFQSGILDDDGNVVREPAAPDVPTPVELYEQIYGKKPSGPTFEAFKLIVGSRAYGKTLLLPPKAPADIVDIYDQAVAKMMKDPNFLKDAERLNPGGTHFFGNSLKRNYPAGVSGPPQLVEFMRKVYTEKYGVNFD